MTAVDFEPLVSEYVGLVSRLESCLVGTAEGRMHAYVCSLASDERLLGDGMSHVGMTAGWGRTRDSAASAALGEAVERYAATHVPSERLVHATAQQLGPRAVDPTRFALFAPQQHAQPGFPFVPFDASVLVPWTRGWSLADGGEAWVPAELVYLGDVPTATPIGYATSNGAACATERSTAVALGLYELLERDAFMLVWANRCSLPLLHWRGHRKLAALDDRYFAPTGLHYAVVDLSPVHGIPSALAIVRSPGGAPIGVGAGAAATAGRAWWKALTEAFATHAAARRMAAVDGPPAADEIHEFHDHIRYYTDAEHARAVDFLDASRSRVDVREIQPLPRSPEAATEVLLARIARAGSSAYAVELTSPDVARLGFRVVKTIAPELCALDASHRARFLGGARIRRAAFVLGLTSRPFLVEELNPDPHPFP